ncbi:MAG: CbrC family protein [Planctomycetes bacterium]|nr:CbrC family protein [Planctomycetota bacterium]
MAMTAEFPSFKYHRDPIASGAFARTDSACSICGSKRGFKYEGEIFSQQDFEGVICPWCVADGKAAIKLNAEFTDPGASEAVSDRRFSEELACRTPAYTSFQGPYWPAHCGDYCCFVDYVGGDELRKLSSEVRDSLFEDLSSTFENMEEAMEALHREGSAVGYLFRCLKCEQHRLFWDCD